jgi:hypothetical protein
VNEEGLLNSVQVDDNTKWGAGRRQMLSIKNWQATARCGNYWQNKTGANDQETGRIAVRGRRRNDFKKARYRSKE